MTSGPEPTKWSDQTVVCVASGPSLTAADCELVRRSGLPCVAVNSSWKAVPFCAAIYAGDHDWWKNYGPEINVPAERWTCLENTALKFEINRHGTHRNVTNSGARAMEFIIEAGAKRIIMLGFDCSLIKGSHFHGDHKRTQNPKAVIVRKWVNIHFPEVAAKAKQAGTKIINCSRETTLTCFRRMTLEEALSHGPDVRPVD